MDISAESLNDFSLVYVILGNVVDVQSGEWIGQMSGVGAGLDSFYEYLLKVKICEQISR